MMNGQSNSRGNLFGVIKYWAAYAVLMLHYDGIWRIRRGYTFEVEAIFQKTTFFPPVIIFLAISGFLTAGSLARSTGPRDFFAKKIRRIYIPLWISMAVYLATYLVIAREYIDASIFTWIIMGMLGVAYTPSCLKEFATGSANGVLWTVTVLIELYVLTGITWTYIKRISGRIWIIVILPVLVLVNILSQYLNSLVPGSVFGKILERSFIPYAIFFFLGMAAYLYRDKLGNLLLIAGVIAIAVLIIYDRCGLPDYGYYTGMVRGLCTSVAAIGIGSWSPESIGDHGLAGVFGLLSRFDFTYEMYLYQWLVFNVLVALGWYDIMEWNVLHDWIIWLTLGVAVCMWSITRLAGFIIASCKNK